MLLALMAPVIVWGQSATLPDGDGYYYITNNDNNNQYYLKPATIYYQDNSDMPFLTTNKTGQVSGSLWIIKTNGDYYQIIHAEDMKYVTTNEDVVGGSNTHRKRMHLENINSPGDANDFMFIVNGSSYNIKHKSLVVNGNLYWNPSGGNKDYDDGGSATGHYSGIVGLFNGTTGGSLWNLTFVAKCVTPEISVSPDGIVTITSITPGATISYSTDDWATSTTYNGTFQISGTVTVKAKATKTSFTDSEVAELAVTQTATPTFDQTNCDNTITINCASVGATIVYTTDDSAPTTSNGNLYTIPFTPANNSTIKAAAYVNGVSYLSSVATLSSYSPSFSTAPTISISENSVTIQGVGDIYYTTDGTDPIVGNAGQLYDGNPIVFAGGSGAHTVKAIAKQGSLGASCIAEQSFVASVYISDAAGLAAIADNPGLVYKVTADIDASSFNASINNFTGTLEGNYHTISGLRKPIFSSTNGATIRNLMLKEVSISQAGNVGAIVCDAKGYTRIYNCGILPTAADFSETTRSSVDATGAEGCAGGLVGKLEDDSRVVNCFSYADVSSTGYAAGIVGNNTYASNTSVTDGKYANLRTMVVNCMFYGDITAGSHIWAVYGGTKITNSGSTAINNYNFYSNSCSFCGSLDDYNCSWPAQQEYLTRYEYHRYLLNSNRALCGWWVGAPSAPSAMSTTAVQSVAKDSSLMAKWVLDTTIAPYPILKPFGKYFSPTNIDANASWRTSANKWEGKKLGSVSVTINPGSHAATGIISTTKSFTITDMDTLHGDYCYRKIQLPYYNSVFGNPNGATWAVKYAGNYGEYVVTGWEITATNGATGTFTEDWSYGYNFAARDSSAKDLYSVSGRIFAQGGYYYVPYDVTTITITAHWGKACYIANGDYYYDRVDFDHSSNKAGSVFAPAGTRSTTLDNGQNIRVGKIADVADSYITTGTSVYDNALVLVSNHQYCTGGEDIIPSHGFTIMSIDLDFDEEPDYCLEWQLGVGTTRQSICPIRFDFLPILEIGLCLKKDGSTRYYSLGCYRPLGHYEVTETALIRFGQFEFGNSARTIVAPLILNGGIFEQYVKGTKSRTTANDYINYVIIGGNVYMPSFTPGAHVNKSANYPTRHCAVNVLGGRIDNLYLTGNYNENVTPNTDNPHCYMDGGWIDQVAAAGTEGINGDVYFRINHSRIKEFYGGSTMATKRVTGNIDVTIDSSIVTKYCGGPMFGDMYHENNKTITTRATGTTFIYYYGGGNGGTSYVQYDKTDGEQSVADYSWGGTGKVNSYTPKKYIDEATGYHADYDMTITNVSTGTNSGNAIYRTYFYAAQFSATNTGSITNTLTRCKVLKNFYGAGNLGGVYGDVTSTLIDTEVDSLAFGAGFSAQIPSVTIHNKDKTAPSINVNTGIITPQSGGTSTTYTWTDSTTIHIGGVAYNLSTSTPTVTGSTLFYTTKSLSNLGTVNGNVSLILKGSTIIGTQGDSNTGNVFGGGDQSAVSGNTTVNLEGNTKVLGNVYGGGNNGPVGGNSSVTIQD